MLSPAWTIEQVAMNDWLAEVDAEDGPAPDVIESMVELLKGAGITSPRHFVMAEPDEVAALWSTAGGKSFLRRAVKAANAAFGASSSATAAVEATPPMADGVADVAAGNAERLADIFGGSELAAAVVHASTGAQPAGDVNVAELLKQGGFENTPYSLVPEIAVWQGLEAESKAARKAARTAFTFVDLTSRAVLPVWMSSSHVGGSESAMLAADTPLSTLGALSSALKGAMGNPRSFRTTAQWSAAWNRYSIVAVCCRQFTPATAHSHFDVICKLAEDERLSSRSPLLAILYDALLRETWARRARLADATLDIALEAQELQKPILDSARQRLDSTGLRGTGGGGFSSSSSVHAFLDAESASARQASAAQALTRKAESTARALSHQQTELAKRERAMRSPSPPSRGERKQKRYKMPDPGSRKDKREQWWKKTTENKRDRGWKR